MAYKKEWEVRAFLEKKNTECYARLGKNNWSMLKKGREVYRERADGTKIIDVYFEERQKR